MRQVNFKGSNYEYTDQDGNVIPAFKSDDKNGVVVLRFKFGFWERIYILFFGNIWFSQATYNAKLKPFKLSIFKNDVLQKLK